MLLAVVRCSCSCRAERCICRPCTASGFNGESYTDGRNRIDKRIMDRVSEMKADEAQEALERGLVLEFAEELPRLRKLWTWRECDRNVVWLFIPLARGRRRQVDVQYNLPSRLDSRTYIIRYPSNQQSRVRGVQEVPEKSFDLSWPKLEAFLESQSRRNPNPV